MRTHADIIVRKLSDTTGQPVRGLDGNASWVPVVVDPFVPAMANGVERIAYGARSRYFVRIVKGVRFERYDEFAFQHDLVGFRSVIRLDGALVDTRGQDLRNAT